MIRSIIKGQERTLLICIAISLGLYMTAAWKSAIYLHPDEYYQIVEFASYKMHVTAADQMAWEFGEKIRPATQPLMCYTLLKTMNAIHITDHYTQLYLLRVLSAFFSLFTITLLCVSSLSFVNDAYKKVYITAHYLFWYPYTYGVHFSSEAWSGSMILIAVSLTLLYYQAEKKKSVLAFSLLGLLLGFAFLLRLQTAFMSVGILAWLLFEKKEKTNVLIVISAGALMLAAGTVIDRWFYGEWLCVPYRYFDSAFIHQRADFGTQPFYFYPLFLTILLSPPIGLVIVLSVLIFFVTQPRTLYAWTLLPFLFFHTIIGHKELRFMYPVVSFFPLVTILAYQGLKEKNIRIPKWMLIPAATLIIAFNALYIVMFVFNSDRFLFDSKTFCGRIHEMARDKKVVVYYSNIYNSPYVLPKSTIPRDLFPEYMREKNISDVMIPDVKDAGVSHGDTIRLISTDKTYYDTSALAKSTTDRILARTLVDVPFIKKITGDDIYGNILGNTYYLIQCHEQ